MPLVRSGTLSCTSPSVHEVGGGACGGAGFLQGCRCDPFDKGGQATVEAAVVLPSLMLVLALLMQPVCLSYTRAIMRATAAECARAAATAYGGDTSGCREYALRRLEAVPDVALFHVGGREDWDVSIDRSDSHVNVSIAGHARPLPLMGAIASLLSMSDGTGVVLRVTLSESTRASWVGGDYGSWQDIWK